MAKQKIFFSYSRVDGSSFAKRLAVDLKAKGYDVWIDQEDIRAGLDWDTEIEKALESCDCLLFVETEKSVASKNVLDEVYYALDQNKKVIPLICVDSKTPYRLARLQHLDFTKDYSAGLAQLVAELEGNPGAIAYQPASPAATSLPQKPHDPRSYKTSWMIGGLALLLVAALVIIMKKQPDPGPPAERSAAVAASVDSSPAMVSPLEEGAASTESGREIVAAGTDASTGNAGQTSAASAPADVGRPGVATRPVIPVRRRAIALREQGNDPGDMDERVSGDWRLTEVQPKASSQNGYLKIEALGEGKATIKAYIQFYYPDRATPPHLTVFNSFVGCPSCVVKKEMKLKVEDIAVAIANANKSVYGKATLEFVNDNTAVIKVTQPNSVELSNGSVLKPFVYTFQFSKRD